MFSLFLYPCTDLLVLVFIHYESLYPSTFKTHVDTLPLSDMDNHVNRHINIDEGDFLTTELFRFLTSFILRGRIRRPKTLVR